MKTISVPLMSMLLSSIAFAHDESPVSISRDDHVNKNVVPWSYAPIAELDHQLPIKTLHEDTETGMSVLKIKYEAGFTNSWRTHNTGHGMYVLDGRTIN